MEDNIYKIPESDLIGETYFSNDDDFQVVSVFKFTVLYLATIGIYEAYWFYKNWSKYNIRHKLGVWPVARAIFPIFFVHQLLNHINNKITETNTVFNWNPDLLATLWVLIAIFNYIYDRLPYMGVITYYLPIIAFILIGVSYAILLKAQKAINITQNDPNGLTNSEFTFANYLWIILGLSLWTISITFILAAYGLVDLQWLYDYLEI